MAKRTRKKKKSNTGAIVAVVLAFAVIIGFLAFYSSQEATSDVLVTVNGAPITQANLDFQYNLLPDAYKAQLTKEQVLEQIIDEELVMQEAVRSGVEVKDEDVQKEIQYILQQGGLTLDDFQKNLEHFNVTVEEFENLVRRQLLIRRLTDARFTAEEPTETELEALYESTKDQYAIPAQVAVRHILISNQRSDAAVLAKAVYDAVREGGDFCAFVQNSSDDKGSLQTCGEYTFPRGFMVPEFEDASFEMRNGEFRLVQTTFGYHVIEKLRSTPARTKAFSEVRDDVANAYASLSRSSQYAALIGGLRDAATIVYGGEETPVADPAEESPVEEAPANTRVTITAKDPAPAADGVLGCIASKATLYGASWSADTQEIADEFGPDLTVVLCDETACDGIEAYPAWKIDGKILYGRQTVEQLQEATGC